METKPKVYGDVRLLPRWFWEKRAKKVQYEDVILATATCASWGVIVLTMFTLAAGINLIAERLDPHGIIAFMAVILTTATIAASGAVLIVLWIADVYVGIERALKCKEGEDNE